jgi:hypothetical protein
VKRVHPINDAVQVVLVGAEMRLQLGKDRAGEIDHIVPPKAVELHDCTRQLLAPEMMPAPKTLKRLSCTTRPNSVLYQANRLMTSRSSGVAFMYAGCELIFDARVEFLREERQVAENVMEHIRFGREFHLVAGAQVIGDEENALGEFFIPIIGKGVAHHRPLDVPARTRRDAVIQMRHRRNAVRVELQQLQPVFHSCKYVPAGRVDEPRRTGPPRSHAVRWKSDLLIFGRIFRVGSMCCSAISPV